MWNVFICQGKLNTYEEMHAQNDKFLCQLPKNNYWPYPRDLSNLYQASNTVNRNGNVNCSSIFPWPHFYLGGQPTWRPWTQESNFGRSLDNSLQKIHETNGSKSHYHSQSQTNCRVFSSDNVMNLNNAAHERRPLNFGHPHHPPPLNPWHPAPVLTNEHRNFNNGVLSNKSFNLSKGLVYETKHPQTININNNAEGAFTNTEKPPYFVPKKNFVPCFSNPKTAVYDNNIITSRLENSQIPRDIFSNRSVFCENNNLFRHFVTKNYEEQCFGKPPPPYTEPTIANQCIRNNNFIQPTPSCNVTNVKNINETAHSDFQSIHQDVIGMKRQKKLESLPEPPKKILKTLPKPPEKNSDQLLELHKENSEKLPEFSEKFDEIQQKDLKVENEKVDTLTAIETDQKISNKINRKKLKLLIKYVQDDSESPSFGNENVEKKNVINQNSNRRKLKKESIVKNKSNTKEMEMMYKNIKNSSLSSQIFENAEVNVSENKITQKRINGKRKGESIHSSGSLKSKRCSNSVKKNKDDNDENKEVNKLTIKTSDKMNDDKSENENPNKLTINKIEGDFQNCQICHLKLPRELLWINAMSKEVKCINCCIKSKSAEFALLKKAVLM